MKQICFAVGFGLVVGLVSMGRADDPKQTPPLKDGKSAVTKGQDTDAKKTMPRGEKPAASPGWVVIEEDWWSPFVYEFSTTTHKARAHYRAREDNAAAAEIDKSISWMEYAKSHADRKSAEALTTAEADLREYSAALKSGSTVVAKKFDAAFAQASLALAGHHHYQSWKWLAEGEMYAAGRSLMAAADLIRTAAKSANLDSGEEVAAIYDDYAPSGYWDDTIVFEKSKLETNLKTIESELQRLGAKMKSNR